MGRRFRSAPFRRAGAIPAPAPVRRLGRPRRFLRFLGPRLDRRPRRQPGRERLGRKRLGRKRLGRRGIGCGRRHGFGRRFRSLRRLLGRGGGRSGGVGRTAGTGAWPLPGALHHQFHRNRLVRSLPRRAAAPAAAAETTARTAACRPSEIHSADGSPRTARIARARKPRRRVLRRQGAKRYRSSCGQGPSLMGRLSWRQGRHQPRSNPRAHAERRRRRPQRVLGPQDGGR